MSPSTQPTPHGHLFKVMRPSMKAGAGAMPLSTSGRVGGSSGGCTGRLEKGWSLAQQGGPRLVEGGIWKDEGTNVLPLGCGAAIDS
jgi:hypothetical protein